MSRFKIGDIDNERFYQIPKSLFTSKNYKGLGNDGRIIYALLKDRMALSRRNKWQDENGDIYLLFTQEQIADLLDVSVSTVVRAMKRLRQYDLIEIVRQGLSKPNKIYINKTCDGRQFLTCQIDKSGDINLESQEVSNCNTNDTEYSDTDNKETDKEKIVTCQPKHNFAEFVSMTNDEYSSLIEKLGGKEPVQRCIEILDNYKGSTGKKYKSDYRAILSWVIEKYQEGRRRSPGQKPKSVQDMAAEAQAILEGVI